jgi:hypothetical protein
VLHVPTISYFSLNHPISNRWWHKVFLQFNSPSAYCSPKSSQSFRRQLREIGDPVLTARLSSQKFPSGLV